jgi:hypothetical protein
MNVKRTELLKALKQCLPGIENGNSILEGADLFIFNKGFVHSYNDIISVSVPVKSEGLLEEGIEGAVRAEEFYSIINKFNGDLIEFVVADGKWILKSGRAKAELTLMAGNFSERFENIMPDKKKWLEITPEFTQGLGICRITNNKETISGLYITPKDIVSSDGLQINYFKYKGADFENFWISDSSAGELLKVGVLTHIQLKETWAHFKTADNTTFSIKTLQAEKWPYEKILGVLESHKKTKTSVSATFPKELFDAIDRASSFYLDILDTKAVRLSISPKRIMVSAERVAGKYEEKVAWKEEPPEFPAFELYVDTVMILFAARRSMSFYIHENSDGTAPRMIFTTDNSTHLMVTLTIDDEEKVETSAPAAIKKAPAKTEPKKKNEETADDDNDTPPWKEPAGKKTESKKDVKKPVKKPVAEKEEDEEEKPAKKPEKKNVSPPPHVDDDEDEDDEDDEPDVDIDISEDEDDAPETEDDLGDEDDQ